ncbi:MAG: hypothetical protein HY460_00890, partial [Parcubacteria group bacterium]|nr:hypothetical protein [Parcubacteria group bacterium]
MITLERSVAAFIAVVAVSVMSPRTMAETPTVTLREPRAAARWMISRDHTIEWSTGDSSIPFHLALMDAPT